MSRTQKIPLKQVIENVQKNAVSYDAYFRRICTGMHDMPLRNIIDRKSRYFTESPEMTTLLRLCRLPQSRHESGSYHEIADILNQKLQSRDPGDQETCFRAVQALTSLFLSIGQKSCLEATGGVR